MRVDEFAYELPPGRIADRPAEPREAARLLDVHAAGLADRTVAALPELLRPGDLLVVNDTRVIPARLIGRRGTVAIEATLLQALDARRWRAFARPGKRLSVGDRIDFAADFTATVEAKAGDGEITLAFSSGGASVLEQLERHGSAPLPPYIRRAADARDRVDYQTIFAARPGAVAAPTAGLHLTPALLRQLADRNIALAAVTLHVGAGTFLPVKVADTEEHRMHAEWASLSAMTAAQIAQTRGAGGRIVALGTTSLRVLESAARAGGAVQPYEGLTDLFITPGFRFAVTELLLTNFHLPRSTLIMLLAAFAGLDRVRDAYAHAIAHGYRFYSYGDCGLWRRADAGDD